VAALTVVAAFKALLQIAAREYKYRIARARDNAHPLRAAPKITMHHATASISNSQSPVGQPGREATTREITCAKVSNGVGKSSCTACHLNRHMSKAQLPATAGQSSPCQVQKTLLASPLPRVAPAHYCRLVREALAVLQRAFRAPELGEGIHQRPCVMPSATLGYRP